MEASAEEDGETKAGAVEAGQQENLPPASAKAEGDYLKHLKEFRDQLDYVPMPVFSYENYLLRWLFFWLTQLILIHIFSAGNPKKVGQLFRELY